MSLVSDSFPPPINRSLAQRLRSWFFTGLVVFGPVGVTAYLAWWAVDTVDNWVRPWFPLSLTPDGYLPFHVPGFGVIIAIVGLTLLGFLTANFVGRSLVRFGEAMLDRPRWLEASTRASNRCSRPFSASQALNSERLGWSNFR